MADRQLIIVVSDILRRWDYLDIKDAEKDALQVGDRYFIVQQEFPTSSDPWKAELRDAILKRLHGFKDSKSVELRIAVHASTFFGRGPNPRQTKDRRFPAEEKLIQQSLDDDLDIQVWAFHHEPEISDLWTVMQRVPDIPSDDDTSKLDFFQQLENTFRKLAGAAAEAAPVEEAQRMWEELSVIRHQIIGLFDPTRLRLESAREKEPAEAAAIKASVESSLEAKREQAHSLLKRAQRFAPSEVCAKCISDLKAHLDKVELQNFSAWLRSLDDKLNLFRSTATGRQ